MACPAHNFASNRRPTGDDDPCNTSGEGVFEKGSYWYYDGTDPAVGSCPELFIRTGDNCNVAEWLNMSIPGSITDTRPPVNGADCCPIGSIWCMPAGTAGTTVNQVWISGGETCGGACASWFKLCGHTVVEASYEVITPVPAGAFSNLIYENQIIDTLNEYDPVAGTFTASEAKKVIINAGFQANFPGYNITGQVGSHTVLDFAVSVLVNGIRVKNIAIDNRTNPADDGVTLRPLWTPNAGGTVVLDLAAGDVVSFEFFHDSVLDAVSLTPGDGLWNHLTIAEGAC